MPVAIMLSCAARSVPREPRAERDLRRDLWDGCSLLGRETKMWKTVLRAALREREYDAVMGRALDLGCFEARGKSP